MSAKSLVWIYVGLVVVAGILAVSMPDLASAADRIKLGGVLVAAVGGLMAFSSSLRTADLSQKFQMRLAQHSETFEMWRELFGAASAYYRVLQSLEHGVLDREQCRKAETRFEDAERWLVHAPNQQLTDTFWDTWQDFRRVAERAETLGDTDAKKGYWVEQAPVLGKRLQTFRVDLARTKEKLLKGAE